MRDRLGWHVVAKVNKTTVSVKTGHSWTNQLVFDKILAAKCLNRSA